MWKSSLPCEALPVLQKVHVHLAAVAVPWPRAPRFRADVDVAVAVHVAHLQLMAAEFRVEKDAFTKRQAAEIFPDNPPRVLPAGGQQFLLFVGKDVGFPSPLSGEFVSFRESP